VTDQEFDELKLKHAPKRIARITLSTGDAVFKQPPKADYKRFQKMLHDEQQRPDAAEFLARACVIHPSAEVFDAWLDDQPGIVSRCGDLCAELAGVQVHAEVKR
jgi:hypothetical protein